MTLTDLLMADEKGCRKCVNRQRAAGVDRLAEATGDEIQRMLDSGELLRAYDHAQAGLAGAPGSSRLLYQRSLALARMGDAAGALTSLDELPNEDRGGEDILALRGRILKDLALQAERGEREELFGRASEVYRVAHEAGGGRGFALINAATTAFLAEHREQARDWAREVLTLAGADGGSDFYALATIGEALVLLERVEEATATFDRALRSPDALLAKRATAARQLAMLAENTGSSGIADLAAIIRPPPVVFFAGPMFHADAAAEARLAAAIDQMLDAGDVRVAFGGAAAGADLLFGEAVLRRGGELNLILPFAREDYFEQSVDPWGAAWRPRVEALLEAAHVYSVSEEEFVGDPHQFGYGSEIAMGLACLRARHLCTEAVHIVVAEPSGDHGPAGSMNGVALWRATGRAVSTVPAGVIDRRRPAPALVANTAAKRETRSIVFADYAGFSKLGEAAVPRFVEQVMGRVASVLERRPSDVLFRNTWGDAFFAVVGDPLAAADLALTLQESLAETAALSAGAGMRVSLHHGPMYLLDDPVTRGRGYFGTEVTRAARIEPITPVGQVYATEPFAAMLALHGADVFACDYAGVLPLAKGFGAMPMHRLTRRR